MSVSSQDWLSIRQASQLLGVHVATVRTWADKGLLPSYRTLGGHRRFSANDIHRFLEHRQRESNSHPLLQDDRVLGQVRQELQTHSLSLQPWFQSLSFSPSTEQRVKQQEFGQRLLQLILCFVEEPARREFLLDEGRHIAHEYGNLLAKNGLSAGNAARATIHFRRIILKTVLELKLGARAGDEEDARLFQRLSSFLDEILLAILDAYP